MALRLRSALVLHRTRLAPSVCGARLAHSRPHRSSPSRRPREAQQRPGWRAGGTNLEVLYGVHPVTAALATESRAVVCVHLEDDNRGLAEDLAVKVLDLYGDGDRGTNPLFALRTASVRAKEAATQLALSGTLPAATSSEASPAHVERMARKAAGAVRCALLAAVSRARPEIRWHSRGALRDHFAASVGPGAGGRGGSGAQGVLMEAGPLQPASSDSALAALAASWRAKSDSGEQSRAPVVAVLDGVTDPQNLGSIARAVAFLQADGLVISSKNCAPLSPAASKASAGALEVLGASGRLLLADRTHRMLAAARSDGWRVLGADAAMDSDPEASGASDVEVLRASGVTSAEPIAQSVSAAASSPLHASAAADPLTPTLLVLGSEGEGLRFVVREQCDEFVAICPSSAGWSAGPVDSLNVSAAAAVLLYDLCRARR